MHWDMTEAIAYYKTQGAPGDQSALIALLREIQQESGGISREDLGTVAENLEVKTGVLLALIKRISGLRLKEVHSLELCAGPNCGKHTELASLAERLCKEAGGRVELKFVPCMRMCGQGPNIRWDGKVYHKATRELLEEMISSSGNP